MAQAHPHLFVQTWFGKHTHVLVSLVATLGASFNDAAEDLSNNAELENFAWHRKHVNLLYPFLYPSSFAVCKLLESARGSLWLSDRLFTGHYSDGWYEWPVASTGQLVNVPGTELVGVEALGSRSISNAIDANSMPSHGISVEEAEWNTTGARGPAGFHWLTVSHAGFLMFPRISPISSEELRGLTHSIYHLDTLLRSNDSNAVGP